MSIQITSLPVDIQSHIFSLLGDNDIIVCSKVCKIWLKFTNDVMWKIFCQKESFFPLESSLNWKQDYFENFKGNLCEAKLLEFKEKEFTKGSLLNSTSRKWNFLLGDSIWMNTLKPQKNLLIIPKEKIIAIWNLTSRKQVHTLEGHSGKVTALLFFEEKLISGSEDKTIKIWNVLNGQCVATLEGHFSEINDLRLQGNILASRSKDKTIKIWNILKKECIDTLSIEVETMELKNNHLFFSAYFNSIKEIKVWDYCKKEYIKTFHAENDYVDEIRIKENILIASTHKTSFLNTEKKIKIWNLTTEKCIRTIKGNDWLLSSLCLSKNILITADNFVDYQIIVWNFLSGECLNILSGHSNKITCFRLHDELLFSGSKDKKIKVWNLLSGECIKTFEGEWQVVSSLEVQGNFLYSIEAKSFNTLSMWNLSSGKRETHIKLNTASLVNSLYVKANTIVYESTEGRVVSLKLLPKEKKVNKPTILKFFSRRKKGVIVD